MLYSSLIALVALLAIDLVWIGVIARAWYAKWLGDLMAAKFSLAPAALFYVLYAIGISYFVVQPAVAAGSAVSTVFMRGAFLGLLAYATYDLTNQATLRHWPVTLTVVDMAWGALLTGVVATIAYLVVR
ncbi:MAG: DUF2177 family protein [Patescibacteria group bacterium]